MIGNPMPDPRDAVIADLDRRIADFFGAGGKVTPLSGFERPLPVARSERVDPETVLKRRRIKPTLTERNILRKLAEDL